MNSFEVKNYTVWVCIIGCVGSAAMLVNSIYPNNTNAMLSAAVGTGLAVLFVALSLEMLVVNLSRSILDQKTKENDELLAVVLSRAVYKTIAEEKAKENKN